MTIKSYSTSIFILFILLHGIVQAQKFPGLALTPPMGWNSWNTFATNIDEKLVRETADALVNNGFKDAGYNYIILDDGWMAKERDSEGNFVADPVKFPSGMKSLVDYVHKKGLRFGLYSCAGATTCAGYPGSRGHEYQDARQFAKWGVDFLKYDWCDTDKLNAEGAYITMRDALKAAGRPVVFSICEWGDNKPWQWAKEVGHLWRITGDIAKCWDCEVDHGTWSSLGVMRILHLRRWTRNAAGPGHWNDLDMLEVGNGLTVAEDRAHFTLWAMAASPLILGNDIRKVKKETLDILTNKDVVAVNQDSLGVQGFKYLDKNYLEVWVKPLKNEEWALCFLNRKDTPMDLEFDWNDHVMYDSITKGTINFKQTQYQIRDLFKKTDIGSTANVFKQKIGAHDVVLVRLRRKE